MNEASLPLGSDATAGPHTSSAQVTGTRKHRAVVAAAIGNGLEIYDFTVYSFFAAIIGRLFFPTSSPMASLLLSFATFGIGFVMRPLGAVLIGGMADKRGRKAALTLTIGLMTVGTALIAFTPSYASIGVSATVLVVLGRLLQGLSAGGEVGAASALLMESANQGRRCFLASWQAATQGAAALLGALTGAAVSGSLSAEALQSWGWRVPFIIGLLIAPVGIYIRRHLEETHTETREHASLRAVIREHGRTLLLGILLMTSSTSSMYIMVFYMPTYLVNTLHMPQVTAFLAACVAGATMLIMAPLFGRLADRLPRRKPLLIANSIVSMCLLIPNFALLSSGPGLALTLCCIALSVTIGSVGSGAGAAMMMEALPRHHRATGMSIMYSVGVTVFGGFAPLIVTWLIATTGSPLAPAGYLFCAIVISFVALLLFPSHPNRE
ncbi:MFS transporter [Cupriavidus sp. 2SB]|uniref:MFS transporter n=1 Tax=Cupriavidus sp. 2SB TaxID=2502199 RepID=UPI0010F991DD|nr:MFS transporter [Cupriavidus sp. 2SB]